MYTAFFGLREKPFSLSPDPRFLFLSGAHREALAHLLYGIEQGEGFIAVTGEVGTGKTTLCRTLLRRLPNDVDTAFLFNPNLGARELLEALLQEFEIKCESATPRALTAALNEFLLEKRREGRRVLLILDEAQGLEAETLEQVRLLSNLETERAKLLQILMLGQPELDAMLETPGLRQLRERIGVRWRLAPLASEESEEYIAHRLRIAAGSDRNLFSPASLRLIHRLSAGIPRRVNLLCDRSLLAAYASGSPRVTRRMVRAAAQELAGGGLRSGWLRAIVVTAGAMALAAAFVLSGALDWTQNRVGGWPQTQQLAPPELAVVSAAPVAVAPPVVVALAPPSLDPLGDALRSRSVADTLRASTAALLRAWDLHPRPEALGPDLDAALAEARRSGHVVGLRAASGNGLEILGVGVEPLVVEPEDLASHWDGEAHILWRDLEALPELLAPTQRGKGVRWLQVALIELGYLSGEPSGYFDPGTAKALRVFQDEYTLDSDGRVGPLTKMALYRALPRYPIPRLSDGLIE
jgi:general secretion pathway protein A